jgi:glycosyltransferase involved in cell wall biosynthesis
MDRQFARDGGVVVKCCIHMPSGTIWIDISELFDQFRFANHPTGVSRTVLKLADALASDPGEIFRAARPLFWHPLRRCPLTIEDPRIQGVADFFPQLNKLYAAAGVASTSYSSKVTKAIATSLPRSLRYRVFPADNGVVLFTHWARRHGVQLASVNFAAHDSLFVAGSFWLGKYITHLARRARAAGIPVTAFVHDMLLLSHPEWLPGRHSAQFQHGCETFLPGCAAIACNSRYTQEEIYRFIPSLDAHPIQVCRLADKDVVASSPSLPDKASEFLNRKYALCVSTITPRKNHGLLVSAWQHLWHQLKDSTPHLLCVGGGAPDNRLAAMMERHKSEDRVIWLGSVDDGTLEALYGHAWVTIYPSLGEGYGLPVAEALSRGKVCLAAPIGGIQEVAPDLIDSINPLDPLSVVTKVKRYLSDPASLAAREAEIKRRYRSTTWAETARAVRAVVEGAGVQTLVP